jgi:hypothetical protein
VCFHSEAVRISSLPPPPCRRLVRWGSKHVWGKILQYVVVAGAVDAVSLVQSTVTSKDSVLKAQAYMVRQAHPSVLPVGCMSWGVRANGSWARPLGCPPVVPLHPLPPRCVCDLCSRHCCCAAVLHPARSTATCPSGCQWRSSRCLPRHVSRWG